MAWPVSTCGDGLTKSARQVGHVQESDQLLIIVIFWQIKKLNKDSQVESWRYAKFQNSGTLYATVRVEEEVKVYWISDLPVHYSSSWDIP